MRPRIQTFSKADHVFLQFLVTKAIYIQSETFIEIHP